MSKTINITITLLSCASCCHLQERSSSYFTFSFLKDLNEGSNGIGNFLAESELACALRCDRDSRCCEALFHRAAKRCFMYQKKEKCFSDTTEDEKDRRDEKPRIQAMIKMAKLMYNEQESRISSGNKSDGSMEALEGQHNTRGTSCHDILQRNSSSHNGMFVVNIGRNTWRTKCMMNDVSKCGMGAWELVMRIGSSQSNFSYDFHHWTTQASYGSLHKGKECKRPAYWLRNFTKICVTINFTGNHTKLTATILVNYSAKSLYSVMHEGINMTWPMNLPNFKTPTGINESCLVQGLNMPGQTLWKIKSRIGVQSQSSKCGSPYLVRGVGIGYMEKPGMSCGDIIIKENIPYSPHLEAFPAICRVYIQ